MNKIKKLSMIQLKQKEIRIGKRIMAMVMLPLIVFQMTSMNFLAMEMMTARADEAVVTVDTPKEEAPKEEVTTKEDAPKEEVKKEEVEVETPKVEEKVVLEVKEVVKEEALVEVKTKKPKEEVTPVLPVETIVPTEVAPVKENSTPNGDAVLDTPSTETPVAPETEAVVPTEDVQGMIAPEATSAEVPVVAPVVPKETWLVSGNKATTTGPVELGKTYVAPQNDSVTVTFTELPTNPGTLSIKEIVLTPAQVKSLGALSNFAYDVTSSMADGTFKYELTLPKPENQEKVQIKFAETMAGLKNADVIPNSDLKSGSNSVGVALNHFTIFVAARGNDLADATITSGIYIVSPAMGGSGTITDVPFGTSRADFLGAFLASGAFNQSWDDSEVSDPVVTGNRLVITAEDGIARTTYAVTVDNDTTSSTVILADNHADNIIRDVDAIIITATFTEADMIDEVRAPRITISGTPALVNNVLMVKSANLIWTYTWDVPAGNDGVHTVSILAYDRAGNVSDTATGKTSYTIDNIVPTCNVVSVIEGAHSENIYTNGTDIYYGPNLELAADFTISASSTDFGSGVNSVNFDTINLGLGAVGGGSDSIVPYVSSAYTIGVGSSSDSRTNPQHVHCVDNAGNQAQIAFNVYIDDFAPTISIVALDHYNVQGGSTITVTSDGIDRGVGVAACPVYWSANATYDGGDIFLGDLGSDCDGDITVPAGAGTFYAIIYGVTDNVNNHNIASNVASEMITVDDTLPSGKVTVDSDLIYEGDLDQIVTVTYDEPMDPLVDPTINFAGTASQTTQSNGIWNDGHTIWTETFNIADNNEGAVSILVTSSGATDVTGNTEGASTAGAFKLDTIKPIGTVTLDTNPIYEGDLIQGVTVSYSEAMNPAFAPTVTFSGSVGAVTSAGAGAWNPGNTVWTQSFNITDANEETTGVSVVSSLARDIVGNVEGTIVAGAFNIDNAAPTIDAGIDKNTDSDFTQDATASGSGSGIATYLWTKVSGPGNVTFGTPAIEDTTVSVDVIGTYIFRLTVTDMAGNSTYDEFRKYALGKITIKKQTNRSTDQTFRFETSYGVDTELGNGGLNVTGALLPGSYLVKEYSDDNWDFDNIICTDSEQNSTYVMTGTVVLINLVPGADVTCTYNNHNHDSSSSSHHHHTGSSSEENALFSSATGAGIVAQGAVEGVGTDNEQGQNLQGGMVEGQEQEKIPAGTGLTSGADDKKPAEVTSNRMGLWSSYWTWFAIVLLGGGVLVVSFLGRRHGHLRS